MIAHIVCGSPNAWIPDNLSGMIIGVDRGALYLIEKNIQFDIVVGDFDSVNANEFSLIKEKSKKLIKLPCNKDLTDCEAAVDYSFEQGYDEIYLYGTTGHRFDHQYATLGLMLKYAKQGIKICAVDKKNKIQILPPGNHLLAKDGKKYISFFAFSGLVENLSLSGMKYPLVGFDLTADNGLCISNEMQGLQAQVSFEQGFLLVIQSSD